MKNNSIEDIYIGADEKNKKKGKKGIIIVIFIILILILAGLVGAYFYFSNSTVTKKQAFINSFSNTNINKFLEDDIYKEISNRMLNENSETETKMTVSTTENLEEVDVSNLELNIKNNNDIENSKSYAELMLNYSGNEIFKAKVLSTENEFGIASDEIVTKFVGLHYDKIKDTFGIDIDKEKLDELSNTKTINLTDEEKNNYKQKYLTKIFEQIPEEKFTYKDNVVIEKKSGNVNVVSYSLNLSQEELNNILSSVLTELRNDEELLGKLVVESSSTTIEKTNTVVTNNTITTDEDTNTTNTVENTPVPMPTFETTNSSINIYEQTNSSEEQLTEEGEQNNFNSSMTVNPENIEVEVEDQTDLNTVSSNITDYTLENTAEINSNETLITPKEDDSSEISPELISILLGNKANISVSDLQKEIDKLIEQVKKLEGNGITVNAYVNENEKTEKINVILPDASTLNIEFTTNAENANDNSIQITYVTENKIDNVSDENGVITYSAEDTINETTDTKAVSQKNGFELLLNLINNDSNTTLKVKFNNIENDAYNQEVNVEVKTNGNKTSNNIDNDVVIEFKTDKNAIKLLLDNSIKFGTSSEIEDLNSENCVFLDELSEDERATTLQAIIEKVIQVYQDKKENLNFIDTNTNSSIQQNLNTASTNVTKEEAKNALIEKFRELYQNAQNEGNEFTLHNLENLTIDGYEVSTNITDEVAIIVVDTYTFKINSNFELSEE